MFSWFKSILGRLYFWLLGWTVEGEPPTVKKFVFIAAPHTSAWDLPHMLFCAWVLRVNVSWMGKRSLFRAPFGWMLKLLGGIPIDRGSRNDIVRQLADTFAERESLILAIPAEGTRRRVEFWKSGFYHIARAAEVPIGTGFLDFGTKRAGLGPLITPTGNIGADMDLFRAFYGGMTGKHADKFATPKLRDEELSAEELHQPPALKENDEPPAGVAEPTTVLP